MSAGVHARARGGCVIQRCQNKTPDRMWMTPCIGSVCGGFWEIWEKLVELSSASGEDGWLSLARWGLVSGVHVMGADGKASIERWYLSPYVEKPFNSKLIKSFVPELRSRKCFSCFGIPMFYVYILWTFYVRFTYLCMGMLHRGHSASILFFDVSCICLYIARCILL